MTRITTCLVIGDPHFKTNNVIDTDLFHQKIYQLAKDKKPDFIVCLGDILDRHEAIHVNPLERSVDCLKQLETVAPLYILIGNHDRPNNSNFLTTEHPFTALKYWDNTVIVDKVVKSSVNGLQFIFVPYVPPGRFLEAISTLDEKKEERKEEAGMILKNVACVFAHQEFRGAKMGAIESIVGDEWPLSYPYVISGHVHDYDQLQHNLLYTGCPMHLNFGDREDRTVSWVVFQPDGQLKHERIDLDLPIKKLYHVDANKIHDWQPDQQYLNNGTKIKIIVKGSNSEIKSAMKTTKVKELTASGVKIVYNDIGGLLDNNRNLPTRVMSYQQRLHDAVNSKNLEHISNAWKSIQ
jgi:DNA repair exonuclease SbcCD nuclease subunit